MKKINILFDRIKALFSKENKWIVRWVLLSILFALVIHFLFVPIGPSWLQARWGAGDILTYVGTVSLSLLAVWQNKRFKEENDKAQERLERISQQANELSTINKILEHEEHRIEKVTESLGRFDSYSDLTKIQAVHITSIKSNTLLVDMATWKKELQELFGDVIAQLITDPFTDNNDLRNNILDCYAQADTIIDLNMKGGSLGGEAYYLSQCDKLKQYKLDFLQLRNNYIKATNEAFAHIMYDNVSLEEISKMRVNQLKTETNEKK